jgi:threonine synthase
VKERGLLKVPDGWSLSCVGQGHSLGEDPAGFVCPTCGNILELKKSERVSANELFHPAHGTLNVWRYAAAIPRSGKPISLSEGGTPLVQSRDVSLGGLFFKIEGQNPTGSFKDRGMTVAVTRAVEAEAEVLVCASTGNTAASLAAYAARAGLKSAVILPSGKVATGKLAQAMAHGAKLLKVEDGFDKALELTTRAVALSEKLYLLNSINPYRIEGQKTVSFEIYEQLGEVPDYIILPVGNAGNISAVWKGFMELKDWGITSKSPKLVGVQAEGASPIAEAYSANKELVKPWKNPETVASAIRIGNPVSWKKALRAIRESEGMALAVSDREIVGARRKLAAKEGIFVENASAAPLAGLQKIRNQIGRDSKIVCILTGHGLKDKIPAGWVPKPLVAKSAKDLIRLLG